MYYTVNPAVAKSIMSRMTKKQLYTEIAFFDQELEKIPPGNKRSMFLRLRNFAQELISNLNERR